MWQSKGEKVLGKNAHRVGGILIDAIVYSKDFRLTHNRKLDDDRVLSLVGVSGFLPFKSGASVPCGSCAKMLA